MKAFLIALAPSVGVLLIFYIGIKSLIEADRRERVAAARLEGKPVVEVPRTVEHQRSARDEASAVDAAVGETPSPDHGVRRAPQSSTGGEPPPG